MAEDVRERDADLPKRGGGAAGVPANTPGARKCKLPGCQGWFVPNHGKQEYCRKEHTDEAARRRRRAQEYGVDEPIGELQRLGDQVVAELRSPVQQLREAVEMLLTQLETVLGQFDALDRSAVARIAAAEEESERAQLAAGEAERLAHRMQTERDQARAAARADRVARDTAEQQARMAGERAEEAQRARDHAEGARTALEDRVRHFEQRIEKQDGEHQARLTAVRMEHETALTGLRMTHDEQVRAWSEQHTAEVTALRADQERERTMAADRIAALEGQHTQALTQLRADHAATTDRLDTALANAEQRLTERDTTISDLTAQLLATTDARRSQDVALTNATNTHDALRRAVAAALTAPDPHLRTQLQAALDARQKTL